MSFITLHRVHCSLSAPKWLRRLIGKWGIRFGKFRLGLLVQPNGILRIKKWRMRISPSKVKNFPAISGWVTFHSKKYRYYMRKSLFSGLRLYKFSLKKNKKCTRVLRGLKNYCRAGRGGRYHLRDTDVFITVLKFNSEISLNGF